MSRHLKFSRVPKQWGIRIDKYFYTRPNPSGHPFHLSIPLNLLLISHGFTENSRESRYVMRQILLNDRPVSTLKRPVGLFDIIQIGSDRHMVSVKDRRLSLSRCDPATMRFSKLINKVHYMARGVYTLFFLFGYNYNVSEEIYNRVLIGETYYIDSDFTPIIPGRYLNLDTLNYTESISQNVMRIPA